MNRLEAIKAMLEGKKVGHVKNNSDTSYYYISNSANPISFRCGNSMKLYVANMPFDDGYYIIKKKVKKYKVLMRADCDIGSKVTHLMISEKYYESITDFDLSNELSLKGIQLLESTMIEVEEE